jgi:hypothetical protein
VLLFDFKEVLKRRESGNIMNNKKYPKILQRAFGGTLKKTSR